MSDIEIIKSTLVQNIGDEVVMLFELTLSNSEGSSADLYFFSGFSLNDQTENLDLGLGLRDYAGTVRFKDRKDPNVVHTYIPIPCELDGVEINSSGSQNRPTLTVANVLDVLMNELKDFLEDDLIGSRLVVRTTLKKYLMMPDGEDAGGSTPAVEYPIKSFVVDRIASLNAAAIEFELSNPLDIPNFKVPSRVIVGKYCSWQYASFSEKSGCTWNEQGIRNNSGSKKRTTEDEDYLLNVKDEYIVSYTAVNQNHNGEWVSGPYSKNDIVYYPGAEDPTSRTFYQAVVDTVDTDPAVSEDWRILHTWKQWTLGSSYKVQSNPMAGDYVKLPSGSGADNNFLFRCTIPHEASEANKPTRKNSPFWVRGDLCSKTLAGCKRRFHATSLIPEETQFRTIPAVEQDETEPLPFGGVPFLRRSGV